LFEEPYFLRIRDAANDPGTMEAAGLFLVGSWADTIDRVTAVLTVLEPEPARARAGDRIPLRDPESISEVHVSASTRPLRLGPIEVAIPVVLAPMAGVTNAAYRTLCREQGAGLYVCEMITSRGLVERDETTLGMLAFDPGETVRSVQLYGIDATYVGRAVQILCDEYGVAHVDLNFGCPVPKVTRKGGGAALPWKRGLLAEILTAAVRAATPYGVSVTVKTRIGIDRDHETHLDTGAIAEDTGCVAIALHARTADQHYSGTADRDAIARLVDAVDIPVLGNGDIWEASDALTMMAETGCAGVVVGRGCLGRPWLFRDLAAAFTGEPTPALPNLGEVAAMMHRHAELLVHFMGEERGCKEMRKHIAWYLKGFRAGGELRHSLGLVDTIATLDLLLAGLDLDEPFPVGELGTPRGRQGSPRRVALPDGWVKTREHANLDPAAESAISGG
jgi:nifR3 family TIM-barrel protein